MKTKRLIKILIAAALVIAACVAFNVYKSGRAELAQFNSHSMTDWKLGSEISGISSLEDAKAYDSKHFEFFTDKNGSGLKSTRANTRYYLEEHGKGCRVVGFVSTEDCYNVMGIHIGDEELDSKTLLLDAGYRMNGGGLDHCRATNGRVTVYLDFEHGSVTGFAAFLHE